MAFPMDSAAPVTIATLFFNLKFFALPIFDNYKLLVACTFHKSF